MKTELPKPWHHHFDFMLLLLATVWLSSCGGGGSSSTPTTNADPTGYYDVSGTATVKQSDNTTDLTISDLEAMVSNNRVMMMSATNNLLYDIAITSISGNSFNGSAKIYLTTSTSQSVTTATVSGTITTGSSITGTLTGTAAGNGSFSLSYSSQTGTLPTASTGWLSLLGVSSTNYMINITNATTLISPVVVSNGYFSGCNMTGTVTALGNTGLYSVSVDVASCATASLNGSYSGLVAPQDASSVGLAFAVISSDGSHSISADFLQPAI